MRPRYKQLYAPYMQGSLAGPFDFLDPSTMVDPIVEKYMKQAEKKALIGGAVLLAAIVGTGIWVKYG